MVKEEENCRAIIFPFAREKLAVSHHVEQSLTTGGESLTPQGKREKRNE